MARQYVVMGVSGSGKSVIGSAFARALRLEFVEGDAFHPPANVLKMANGTPLTDHDRAGWLETLSNRLRDAAGSDQSIVLTCSALKRAYRDVLRRGAPDLQLIWLRGPRELIEERMTQRQGHFMPASLLDSQLAALEPPLPEEHAWVCDATASPERIVADLVTRAGM
jgi:gluconokinase